MRVFLDANVLFSASRPGSVTRLLFDAAVEYSESCVTNRHALEEARRNIEAKRPAWISGLEFVRRHSSLSAAFQRNLSLDLPPEDIPIAAGAVGSHCSHLWTGDRRHFGAFFGHAIHDVRVVSHTMLADILCTMGWRPNV